MRNNEKIYEWEGKKYQSVPDIIPGDCYNCAFEGSNSCPMDLDAKSFVCRITNKIFKEVVGEIKPTPKHRRIRL